MRAGRDEQAFFKCRTMARARTGTSALRPQRRHQSVYLVLIPRITTAIPMQKYYVISGLIAQFRSTSIPDFHSI